MYPLGMVNSRMQQDGVFDGFQVSIGKRVHAIAETLL